MAVCKESCEESFCDGSISLPCHHMHSAACIKVAVELPNLGTCKSKLGNYECSDLETILVAMDSLMSDCGDDTFLASGALAGGILTLTLNDASTVAVDISEISCWTCDETQTYLVGNNVGIGTATPGHVLDVQGTMSALRTISAGVTTEILNDNVTIASLSGITPPLTDDLALLKYEDATKQALIYAYDTGAAIAFDTTSGVAAVSTSAGGVTLRMSSAAAVYSGLQASGTATLMEATDGVDSTELRVTKDDLLIDSIAGWTGTFVNGDGDTVTVTKGIITNVV